MKKVTIVAAAAAATAVSLAGAGYAFGGGGGVIWDDGHAIQPGSLDDGKELLPRTTVTLAAAVADAQRAVHGALGQVDLVERAGRVLYVVDVGDREVSVDAGTGAIAGIGPQS